MAAPSASTSLSVTVSHAIAYIARPLLLRSSTATILRLQVALEASLMAHYASSWVPSEPLRGSGRRCMTLSPTASPPRPFHTACKAANVDWADWIAALGGFEFDFFVDPGRVSIRISRWTAGPFSQLVTVWSEELARTVAQEVQQSMAKPAALPLTPNFVERLREDDEEEEEELFAMIADEIRQPTWITPVLDQFPTIPSKAVSPVSSLASSHSRSSSTSSKSDFSFFSDNSDAVSVTTAASSSSDSSKMSRRERLRLARIHVDISKKEVTNYDGGKTTVLTGGVMLGAPCAPAPARIQCTTSSVRPLMAPTPIKSVNGPIVRQPLGPSATGFWRTRRL
ncbi:hypothetical protein OF83DRAFT_855378 [Amylostereum chailletii]|nr:hypothetical protein OF83DRAFT_855378 [Amylostereum chailletii]